MKKITRTIIFLFVILFIVNIQETCAQFVTIPDANFRAYVKQNFANCINSSDQLDTLSPILLNVHTVIVSNSILDLTGIQYFKNLRYLDCSRNDLTQLPPLPVTLTYFDCSYNQLTSIPPLPPSLDTFICFVNALTTLPVLPNTITNLQCGDNDLTSLPASLPPSLNILYCDGNYIKTLPNLPSTLTQLTCSANELTIIPTLPEGLANLTCEYNKISCLPELPPNIFFLWALGNNISCIPNMPASLTTPITTIGAPPHMDSTFQVCNDVNNVNGCYTTLNTKPVLLEQGKLVVYPNPSIGTITITYPNATGVNIFGMDGKIIYSTTDNSNSYLVDLSSNAKGIYVLQVLSPKGPVTQKLILE
jgi:Leucine-rich repeat (LRR) protein